MRGAAPTTALAVLALLGHAANAADRPLRLRNSSDAVVHVVLVDALGQPRSVLGSLAPAETREWTRERIRARPVAGAGPFRLALASPHDSASALLMRPGDVHQRYLPRSYRLLPDGHLSFELDSVAFLTVRLGVRNGPLLASLAEAELTPPGPRTTRYAVPEAVRDRWLRDPHLELALSYAPYRTSDADRLVPGTWLDGTEQDRSSQPPCTRVRMRLGNQVLAPGDSLTIRASSIPELSVEPECEGTWQERTSEVMVYVDGKFAYEEENASAINRRVLPAESLAPGRHLLSVNVIDATDRVAYGHVTLIVRP